MSQDDLGYLYGSTHGATSKFEQGKMEPRALTVIRLAGCLEMTVENLLSASRSEAPIRRLKDRYGLPGMSRSDITLVSSASIRKARAAAGLSVGELAAAVGVSETNIRLHEGAVPSERTTLPRLSVWVAMARVLGVRPSVFFDGIRFVPPQAQRKQRSRVWPVAEGSFVRVGGRSR